MKCNYALTLFVFGDRRDPHIKAVSKELEEFSIETIVIGTLPQLSTHNIFPSWSSQGGDGSFVKMVDSSGELEERLTKGSVWWFRNKNKVLGIGSLQDQADELCISTRENFLKGYVKNYGLPAINIKPSNHDKLNQLAIAKSVGFFIPKTIITFSKTRIKEFVANNKQSIVKSFYLSHTSAIGRDLSSIVSIMTSRISVDEVESAEEAAFAACPAIYQEEILKVYEVRLVVFGDMMLAFRCNSQRRDHTKLDWRRGERDMGLFDKEPIAIPEHVSQSVSKIMQMLSLDTAVFDFAVDADQRWIFFECNPSGQWVLLETKDKIIAKTFAKGVSAMLKKSL